MWGCRVIQGWQYISGSSDVTIQTTLGCAHTRIISRCFDCYQPPVPCQKAANYCCCCSSLLYGKLGNLQFDSTCMKVEPRVAIFSSGLHCQHMQIIVHAYMPTCLHGRVEIPSNRSDGFRKGSNRVPLLFPSLSMIWRLDSSENVIEAWTMLRAMLC